MNDWDACWAHYSPSPAERWYISERDGIIQTYLGKLDSPNKKVLEVGCGYGSNIRLINSSRSDTECYALDNSRVALALVKEEVPHTLLADCTAAPVGEDEVDLIFSSGLMEHLDEDAFLQEMRRLLKSDGYLITFVPAAFSLWRLYSAIRFGMGKHEHIEYPTCKELERMFSHNGFDVVEMRGVDPFSLYGFVMKLIRVKFPPLVSWSPLKNGYTEICVVARKRLSPATATV